MEALTTLTEGTKLAPVLHLVAALVMVQQLLPAVRQFAPDMQRAITDSVSQLSDTVSEIVQQTELSGDVANNGNCILGAFGPATDDTKLAQATGAIGMAQQLLSDMKQVAPDVCEAMNAGARRLSTSARRLSTTITDMAQRTGQTNNSGACRGRKGEAGCQGGGLSLRELGLGLLGGALGSATDDTKTDVMTKVMGMLDKEEMDLSDITQLAPDIYDALSDAMSDIVRQMGDAAELSIMNSILEGT
nr:hypothetical protein BaRGS_026230 [Batillaria attramentaria]